MSVSGRPRSMSFRLKILRDRRREAADQQVAVEEDRGDLGAVEQVAQIVVGLVELLDLALQLVVDRLQLLVDRLRLLARGFQFLVGRLQLLVDRDQLLVRRFQLLERGLVLLDQRLQPLARLAQLAFELFGGGRLVLRSAPAAAGRALAARRCRRTRSGTAARRRDRAADRSSDRGTAPGRRSRRAAPGARPGAASRPPRAARSAGRAAARAAPSRRRCASGRRARFRDICRSASKNGRRRRRASRRHGRRELFENPVLDDMPQRQAGDGP